MVIELQAGDPGRADAAVVFACDNNYARFALLAAEQIARAHPERDFDICLCSDEDLHLPPGLARHGFRVCRVATGGAFEGLRLDPGKTDVVYLRLALPSAFAGQYRRLLYLDSDIFVQGGDFGALLRVDLGGHVLGAVRDNMQWRTPGRRPEQFRRLGMAQAPYFNAGVLLIDLERFNEAEILERCVVFGRRNRDRMIRHDQNLLNGTLQGAWAELSPVWNWQYTWASRFFETMADPHVVHFIGPRKPWKHAGGEFPLRFRRAYRAFLAEHFPDGPEVGDDGVVPMTNRAFLQRSLLKHLVSAHKMAAYVRRFPSDMTVFT
jgi:lipopolysaccharide biosynthesis glycosyltransferase